MESFYDRILSSINKKGLTIKGVERETGLANATIRKWDKQSPRLESVIKVAEYLHISLDYLAFGGSYLATMDDQVIEADGPQISPNEMEMIKALRELPEGDQDEIKTLIHMKYDRLVKKKEGRGGSSSSIPGKEESTAGYKMA